MDYLAALLGTTLGYGSAGIILFCFAFVVAKSTGKNWPYYVATVLTILFYWAVIVGNNYLQATGQL
jgi:hypothetical protein